MSMESVYLEIRQSINSGAIVSLPKEKLAQFSAALARSQAYTYFSAPEFPQICETVRALLIARSNEEALAKIPNPTSSPSAEIANKKSNWHEKPLGKLFYQVIGGLVLACVIFLIAQHLGIHL